MQLMHFKNSKSLSDTKPTFFRKRVKSLKQTIDMHLPEDLQLKTRPLQLQGRSLSKEVEQQPTTIAQISSTLSFIRE